MNKRQKRGAALLLIGVLLVLAGLGIHLSQEREDVAAGKTAALLLEHLDQKTLILEPETELETGTNVSPEAVTPPENDPQLPVKTYMGYTLIGSISVPSVGIRLPVLKDWSEEMLKAAPCRYQGSVSGGDMIIMGHNYKSHFTPLQEITVGSEVEFENAVGKVFRYRVAEIEYLHRTEGEHLSSEYPLTIFTCTPGGMERIVVRCETV